MIGSMELPVAVIGAFLLLGESITGIQWLGMLLILAGVGISEGQQAVKKKEKKHA
ncbi:hypothetical protein D3C81_2309710 [compost metagenome]